MAVNTIELGVDGMSFLAADTAGRPIRGADGGPVLMGNSICLFINSAVQNAVQKATSAPPTSRRGRSGRSAGAGGSGGSGTSTGAATGSGFAALGRTGRSGGGGGAGGRGMWGVVVTSLCLSARGSSLLPGSEAAEQRPCGGRIR